MVDLSFLEKFTKGNTTKMKRYISLYLEVTPKIFERMQKDLESQNWNDLAINAHSLKPQVEFMGIESLKSILITIENKVRSNDFEDIKDALSNAEQILHVSESFLTNYLTTLK